MALQSSARYSQQQPRVCVETPGRKVSLTFWATTARKPSVQWLAAELDKLPRRYSWFVLATGGTLGRWVEVSTIEVRGTRHSYYFGMDMKYRGCTREEFAKAFQEFYALVLQAACS